MKILFIMKVKILMLIKWSYMSLPLPPSPPPRTIMLSIEPTYDEVKMNIYIGFRALKLRCHTQYELCGLGNLQKCIDNFFLKLDMTSNTFRLGSKKIKNLRLQVVGSNPYPIMGTLFLKKLFGGALASDHMMARE